MFFLIQKVFAGSYDIETKANEFCVPFTFVEKEIFAIGWNIDKIIRNLLDFIAINIDFMLVLQAI